MTFLRTFGLSVLIFAIGNLAFGLLAGPPGYFVLGMDAATHAQRVEVLTLGENLRLTLDYAFMGVAVCLLGLATISFGIIPLLLLVGLVVASRRSIRLGPGAAALAAVLVLCEIVGLWIFSGIDL